MRYLLNQPTLRNYETTEGYAVLEGSVQGGLFLRSLTKLSIMALPFGHLVGFLMYFAASKHEIDDSKLSKICIWLRDSIGITKSEFKKIPIGDKILSDRANFAIQTLSKHGAFILESILQLVSMVVYQKTSYIAVISTLLLILR